GPISLQVPLHPLKRRHDIVEASDVVLNGFDDTRLLADGRDPHLKAPHLDQAEAGFGGAVLALLRQGLQPLRIEKRVSQTRWPNDRTRSDKRDVLVDVGFK